VSPTLPRIEASSPAFILAAARGRVFGPYRGKHTPSNFSFRAQRGAVTVTHWLGTDGPYSLRLDKLSYPRHRFPSIVIQQAVWLYFRFALSYRDVEDMLAAGL
jgi:hypothetical protein